MTTFDEAMGAAIRVYVAAWMDEHPPATAEECEGEGERDYESSDDDIRG